MFAILSEAFSRNINSRKHPTRNNKSCLFHKIGNLYQQSTLTKQEFEIVQNDLKNLELTNEQATIAHNRVGAIVPKATRQIFQQGSPSCLVQKIVGNEYILSKDIPVEVQIMWIVNICGIRWSQTALS